MKTLNEMTLEEKWEIFPIVLEKSNPNYPYIYKEIESKILEVLSDSIIRINHIGSTSVPNLISKPTIDILIEIKENIDLDEFKEKLIRLGYINTNYEKDPFHMMFLKGYTNHGFVGQVQHIHVHYLGDWDELYFCEYLRIHPEVSMEYEKLKLTLKEKYKHHRDNYTNGKTAFVKKYSAIAKEELNYKYKKG